MKKIIALLPVYFLSFAYSTYAQTIGIGTTTPNNSAMLDVESTNKGMLIPRIALTSANTSSPVTSPADALLVYNTANAGTGTNAVVPGFYYWSTSANRWNTISPALSTANIGFGSWGDCSVSGISEYNPVSDETGAVSEQFGNSVSISGNYAIVGAFKDNVGFNTWQGSASIYRYEGGNWILMQKLTDATGADSDQFGKSVSISGNYAIVGIYGDDVTINMDQGSANIYQYNGTSWVLMQKLTDATGAANDFFGYSVSISGNYAMVGSFGDNIGSGAYQGSASIYQYNGSNWVLMQKVTDATGAPGDQFGYSVSISDNYAIAGAYADDVSANSNQGSASIYRYNGTNWVLMSKLTDAAGDAGDFFGASVSISGNYAIIGAYNDDIGANNQQGSASIYYYNGGSWSFMQMLTDPNGAGNDVFGSSVSISGNYAIVGANNDFVGANAFQGSASIYVRVGLGWQRLQYVTDPGGNANDAMGMASAIDGTGKRFLVGIPNYTNLSGKVVFGKIN